MTVSILMPAYNHERFIAQAIESVLAQQTQYDFELLINDDCSTDNTSKIASEYAKKHPQRIRFFQQSKNQGLLKNYKFLFEQAHGKYIAILESDDVWSNPQKIQKQISFLEDNSEYGLCAGDYSEMDEGGNVTKEWKKDFDMDLNGDWYESLLLRDHIGALTIVFRRELFDKYCDIDDFIQHSFKTLDYPILLSITAHSKACYIHENLASYRIWGKSISNSSDYEKDVAFQDSIFDIQKYIVDKHGTGKLSFDDISDSSVMIHLMSAMRFGKLNDFVRFSKSLKSKELKFRLLRWFPRLWYFQHKIRVGDR